MPKKKSKVKTKIHPWRLCPSGQHWVSAHSLRVESSAKNPDGVTVRRAHCHSNPSGKDQIYPDEIHEIAGARFQKLKKLPSSEKLGSRYGNRFDSLIAGWVKYWSDIFQPVEPLDPNLVKALISTESDFGQRKKALASKGNWARGLMQVTDQTLKILKDEKGELKDYLVNVDENKAYDPNLNICAGVRWLFHKKTLLESKLRRRASWEEVVMEYKSYTQGLKKKNRSAIIQKEKFLKRYESLK